MPLRKTSSPHPKYIAAADILIGDMSDINYEFLLYNRPIILLANAWLEENFPDIGIKTDLNNLEIAIKQSILHPDEYEAARKHWIKRTIHMPFGDASKNILKIAIEKSNFENPTITLIHGNDSVRKTNLYPIYEEGLRNNLNIELLPKPSNYDYPERIYMAVHFEDLNIEDGYKVHLDHGLKGKGTANLDISIKEYKMNNYFPSIDLHITAGEEGYKRTTTLLLGPNKNRAVIAGYPKSDMLRKQNTPQNRINVCDEFGFDPKQKIITYAPAGPLCYEKPGGSLSYKVVKKLKEISKINGYNIIIKLKNKKHNLAFLPLKKIKSYLIKNFYRQ